LSSGDSLLNSGYRRNGETEAIALRARKPQRQTATFAPAQSVIWRRLRWRFSTGGYQQLTATKGELLVSILNNRRDFQILCEESWYRIPGESANKWLRHRWPPRWLAFYQTKVFQEEAYSIRYFSEVVDIKKVERRTLFPNEPPNPKQKKTYYQLIVKPLQVLSSPIYSRRWRRIVFIPSTWDKFMSASEINDLYDDSPLEDRLWAELKRLDVDAERQEMVKVKGHSFFLDFAVYCMQGKLDLETDGDTWHANKDQAKQDNFRDNFLKTEGWTVLRFGTDDVREKMAEYCVPIIAENVNRLGGLSGGDSSGRIIRLKNTSRQLDLFD
jgi:very-short-patch-repair endonuclease